MLKKLVFLAMLIAIASTAWARPVVYTDMSRTNAVRASNGTTDWWTTTRWLSDPNWVERAGAWGMQHTDITLPVQGSQVPGGDIYQSLDAGQTGKDMPMLKMQLTDVLPGDDHIYVMFWMDEMGSPWCVKAGFTVNTLTTFDVTNSIIWAHDSSNRKMLIGDLGLAPDLDEETGKLAIFIDDLPTDNSNIRTWIDGVGAGILTPEPATMALLGLGGLALLRRRK